MKIREASQKQNQHPKKVTRALTRGLAGAALTVTAAMAPAATASAEKARPTEKPHSYIPTRVLEKQVNSAMRHQQNLGALNGDLVIHLSYSNGGTEATPSAAGATPYPEASQTTDIEVIEHPIVKNRRNPGDHSNYSPTSKDFVYGKLVGGGKHRHIELINFDPATMEVNPWSMEDGPLVKPFIFPENHGILDVNNPLTSNDWRTTHGGPLVESNTVGNMDTPWKIGYVIPAGKG